MSYKAFDAELVNELSRARKLIHRYNSLSPDENAEQGAILRKLLGTFGEKYYHKKLGFNES